VLVDTGPIVAMMRQDDAYHAVCKQRFAELFCPLYTCWPVLTEAAWLLRNQPANIRSLLASCAGEPFQLMSVAEADLAGITAILANYEDQGFQLADATLMHLANREGIRTVFTLDLKDFTVFRTENRQTLELIPLQ
jgi:uncharacterized protein